MDSGVSSLQCDLCEAPVSDAEQIVLDVMMNRDVNAYIGLDEKRTIFYKA